MSAGLRIAVDLATRRRDVALATLARARDGERAAQQQLDQLQTYAAETEGRWTLQAHTLATPELLQHHYQFMTRLYHAVQMQQGVMRQHREQVERCTAQLRAAELRRESLVKVLGLKDRERMRATARQEQKDTDEFAAQQMRRLAAERLEGTT